MKRPWILDARVTRADGSWSKWRTHATYATEEAAHEAADELRVTWRRRDIRCETAVDKRVEK